MLPRCCQLRRFLIVVTKALSCSLSDLLFQTSVFQFKGLLVFIIALSSGLFMIQDCSLTVTFETWLAANLIAVAVDLPVTDQPIFYQKITLKGSIHFACLPLNGQIQAAFPKAKHLCSCTASLRTRASCCEEVGKIT